MKRRTVLLGTMILGLVLLRSGEVPRVEALIPAPCSNPGVINSIGPGAACVKNLLKNPGFESGSNGVWGEGSSEGSRLIDSWPGAHQGRYHAWLNGYGHTSSEGIYQLVRIPGDVQWAKLSFYLHITTAETGARVYDSLHVRIYKQYCSTICWPWPVGSPEQELVQYSNVDASSGYSYHEFDLARFKGMTIFIAFEGIEDLRYQTSFHLDDVAVTVPTPGIFVQPFEPVH